MKPETNVTKELWRLRLNWFLTLLIAPMLSTISTMAYLSSFHEFVTNPTSTETESINGTIPEIEPGLGEPEVLYSALIGMLNFGSVIGGLSTGIIIKCVPYWHQFLFAISSHIFGYLLYALSYKGWLLIFAEFLSGLYIGAQTTLSMSYATESSVTYVELKKDVYKNESREKSAARIRNYLFTLHSAGYCLGFVTGPSVAILFTHLPIDHFRSIGWFNMAFGIAFLVLTFFLFRGESSCEKIIQCRKACRCTKEDQRITPGPLQIFIIITMCLFSFVGMIKWGVFESLLNPVLSDSFGLTVQETSYFYLWFAVPRILGSVFIAIFQRIKMSSQLIAIVGILTVMCGYSLIADWQAIPYDPCTEYSPFHHPEIVENQTIFEQYDNSTYVQSTTIEPNHHYNLSRSTILDNIHMFSSIELKFDSGSTVETRLPFELTYNCKYVQVCKCDETGQLCLSYTSDKLGGLNPLIPSAKKEYTSRPQSYSCSVISPLSPSAVVCVNIYEPWTRFFNRTAETGLPQTSVDIQSLQVLTDSTYDIAINACISATVPNRECHWTAISIFTKKRCADCQPICRSKQQTLSFFQFILGMSLLILSNTFTWIPTVAIATNQTPKSSQGFVIALVNTLRTIAQSISPLYGDAAYEGMTKRTFLAAILLAILHLPFLIEFIVLYRKLGPEVQERYTKIKDSDCDESDLSDTKQ